MRQFNHNKAETNHSRIPPKEGQKKVPKFLTQKKPLVTAQTLHQFPIPPSNLEQQYRQAKSQLLQRQAQLLSRQKMYRIEVFKNQKLKEQIQQIDRHFDITKSKITLEILEKNKENKESPLFYNQNGLCPFELILLEESKHLEGPEAGFVCMICFQDIEENQTVINLPCKHTFHKDCGVQHLLGSKMCPNCNEEVDVKSFCKKKLQNKEKDLALYL